MQTFPAISTNTPLASLIPVSYVIILGMALEAVADLRRWSNDRMTNKQRLKKVIKSDKAAKGIEYIEVCSKDLHVGEIIKLDNGS